MSYTNLIYHIVFRTYRSVLSIEEAHERELYAYIFGYAKHHRAKLYRVGGMPDHIHLLIKIRDIEKRVSLAVIVRVLARALEKGYFALAEASAGRTPTDAKGTVEELRDVQK